MQGMDLERYLDGHLNNLKMCEGLVEKVIQKIEDKITS